MCDPLSCLFDWKKRIIKVWSIQRFKYDARGYQSLYNEYKGTRLCRVFKCLITLRTGICRIIAHGGHGSEKLCDLIAIYSKKKLYYIYAIAVPKVVIVTQNYLRYRCYSFLTRFINFQIVRLIRLIHRILKVYDYYNNIVYYYLKISICKDYEKLYKPYVSI